MKFLGMKKVHSGHYLKHYELTYENRAGIEKTYEMVSFSEITSSEDIGKNLNGVSIVAFQGEKLLLLKEFRMGVNRYVYNLCAGMLEKNETMEECIARELFEETGLQLKRVIKILPPSFAAVSISDIRTQIAFIEVSGQIEYHTSPNEELTAAFYTKEEVTNLLQREAFSDKAQLAAFFFTNL